MRARKRACPCVHAFLCFYVFYQTAAPSSRQVGVRGVEFPTDNARIVQAVGGSMLTANSAAILTDAFPARQRGMALGVNQITALAGMFLGLLVGGLLAVIDWRAVFWVSVPVGVIGTIWSYVSLREIGTPRPGRIDWIGNITFTAGAGALLAAVTYGIQPYGVTRRVGPTLASSPAWRPGSRCSSCSVSPRTGSPSRCSGSGCSASVPSPPGTSPRC